jgi:hypothetical protein
MDVFLGNPGSVSPGEIELFGEIIQYVLVTSVAAIRSWVRNPLVCWVGAPERHRHSPAIQPSVRVSMKRISS